MNARKVFNAICWVLSIRKWIAEGMFEKILQALIDTKYSLLEIDSTFCKVHQNAAGALKKLGTQAIGVSRGGKTTKIHALVNENFQLINVILTSGEVHDSECAIDLLSARW